MSTIGRIGAVPALRARYAALSGWPHLSRLGASRRCRGASVAAPSPFIGTSRHRRCSCTSSAVGRTRHRPCPHRLPPTARCGQLGCSIIGSRRHALPVRDHQRCCGHGGFHVELTALKDHYRSQSLLIEALMDRERRLAGARR